MDVNQQVRMSRYDYNIKGLTLSSTPAKTKHCLVIFSFLQFIFFAIQLVLPGRSFLEIIISTGTIQHEHYPIGDGDNLTLFSIQLRVVPELMYPTLNTMCGLVKACLRQWIPDSGEACRGSVDLAWRPAQLIRLQLFMSTNR